jgi:hypothetical protein
MRPKRDTKMQRPQTLDPVLNLDGICLYFTYIVFFCCIYSLWAGTSQDLVYWATLCLYIPYIRMSKVSLFFVFFYQKLLQTYKIMAPKGAIVEAAAQNLS